MLKHSIMLASAIALAGTSYSDVIFSEYIEGSSNNKALEIQNTGSSAVDLTGYSIELYSNGNLTVQNSLQLTATIEAGAVYVIANSSAVADIQNVADITSAVTFFNGNDVLLLKQNDQVIDRIGQLGNGDTFAANITLVRDPIITTGDPQFDLPFDSSVGWISHPQNTFTFLGNGEVEPPPPPVTLTCLDPAVKISEIQGNGASSPLTGNTVIIEAIVTADLQNTDEMRGFFVQEEDQDADADAVTSEGLFVFHTDDDVNIGDTVRISGTVDEFYGFTQLNQIQAIKVCATGSPMPTAANVTLPFAVLDTPEAVEGMRVNLDGTLTVNEVYNLGRYGEFLISDGRRFIPTDIATPGPDADAVADINNRNSLLVEDGIRTQNPDPLIFPAPGLDAYNTLRVGDTVNNLTGVMNFAYGAYKLIPTSVPEFSTDNLRTDAPVFIEESDMRLASFNVLNYFNGDGLGEGFPTPRGADSVLELERQTAKLVAAITAIDADIIGLMEIENDGFDANSAIASLVNALNAQQSVEQQYDYVVPDVELIGDDAIAVGLLFRPSSIALVNSAAILNSTNSPTDDEGNPLFIDSLNRPALAQSFEHLDSSERFTVVVNHLKSKGGSNCDSHADCDEGQGAYNRTRTNAAEALSLWLATNPTGVNDQDILVMGDLNAYSKEDPITMLESAGFKLLKEEGGYSYVYNGQTGSLDHAMTSSSLSDKINNIQDWHINTDEPKVLDYNVEFKSDAQVQSLYAPTPFRSSDHDPVILDFSFNEKPEAMFQAFPFLFWYIFINESVDPDGSIVAQTWNIGGITSHYSWMPVSKWYIYRNHIRSATLTVEDDSGATSTITSDFR